MDFNLILKEVTERAGGVAAVIMGKDGLPVDSFKSVETPYSVEDITVEYGSVLKDLKKISDSHMIGDIEDICLSTGKSRILLKPINDEYFMALAVGKEVYIGKARFALRRAVEKVKEEF